MCLAICELEEYYGGKIDNASNKKRGGLKCRRIYFQIIRNNIV